jgi:uncharacterized protein
MGLSRDDVRDQRLPLPLADYVAESGEERLVMYADKFHSKTRPPMFVTAASYAVVARSYGEDKLAAFNAMHEKYGDPDLAPFTDLYGHRVA